MAFFGLDTNPPRDRPGAGGEKGIFEHSNPFTEVARARRLKAFQGNEEEILDFEDTYDGLGDRLEEAGDDLNDDTFGGGAEGGAPQGATGKDFDFFGRTAQVSDVIGEEQLRYSLQHPGVSAVDTATSQLAQKPKRTGYEKYQDPGYIPDIQAKSGAWSSKVQPYQEQQGSSLMQATAEAPRISTARNQAQQKRPLTLEEIEAAMYAQIHQPAMQPYPVPYPMHQQPPPPIPMAQQYEQPFPPTLLSNQAQSSMHPPPAGSPQRHAHQSLQILQNPHRARQSPQPTQDRSQLPPGVQMQPPHPATAPTQGAQTQPNLMELSEEQRNAYIEEDARRAKRNHKIFMLSKGNGLMTPQDKNFITRIQLQQLVTATGGTTDSNPEAALTEDFYYQVYSQIRGAPRQHPTQPLGHFAQTYLFQTGGRMSGHRRQITGDNHMQRMQQQVQRAVEAAKLKPKNKQLIIEGSLGKISFSNAKTPKPLLNIKRPESTDTRPSTGRKNGQDVSPSDRKTVLRNIEAVYTTLMKLEDHERRMPPPPTQGDNESTENHIRWNSELQQLVGRLWQELKVLDPIVPGSTITHPFIAFLSLAKGKKAVPRVFRQIDQEQRVTILTMIVVHLDQLDVVRNGRIMPGESQPSRTVREEIDLFSQAVMPCLLSYVSEAPINIVIGLVGLVLDHTNVVNVTMTKIGLEMLIMLLSRAELVRETGAANDQDWQQWASIYNRLFDVIEPYLPALFPIGVNAGDDTYVWQFLAAMGVGANPEQQQRLVIGVKDRVMETVAQSKTLPPDMASLRRGNVNLFMRAIGLDVDMLG